MYILIIIGLILVSPVILLVFLFGAGGGGASGESGSIEDHDYHFPSDEILHDRLEAGYYDDDPDMLEIHDPDRFYDLYGDDPDIYDDDDF